MTFHFAYQALMGTPVPALAGPRPLASWTRCAETGQMVRHWQTGTLSQAEKPVCGHEAPPGADDLLTALLRRHQELRAA